MAKSSIHIQAGKMGFFGHNSREHLTKNAIFDDEENYFSSSLSKSIIAFKQELQKRSEKYTERTGQKLQKNAITHLSAILNFNKEHTPEDVEKVCDYLEKTFDTKVIQYAMHRDEGHISDDGEAIKNYHAHIEFLGLDSEGNSIRKKLDRKALIELQSEVANIMGMERGRNYTLEKEKRPKRLDTYEFKEFKEKENISQKVLKEKIKELRAELQERGATRSDYAELEKTNAELKRRIKQRDLSIEEFQAIISELQKEKYHPTMTYKDGGKATFKDVSNHFEKKYEAIKDENSNLNAHISKIQAENVNLRETIEKQKKELVELKNRSNAYFGLNEELKDEIKKLKDEIKSNSFEIKSNESANSMSIGEFKEFTTKQIIEAQQIEIQKLQNSLSEAHTTIRNLSNGNYGTLNDRNI